jgi:hypothetical protein
MFPSADMTNGGNPVASATSSAGEIPIAFRNRFKLHNTITITATPNSHLQISSATNAAGAETSARKPSAVGDLCGLTPTAYLTLSLVASSDLHALH